MTTFGPAFAAFEPRMTTLDPLLPAFEPRMTTFRRNRAREAQNGVLERVIGPRKPRMVS